MTKKTSNRLLFMSVLGVILSAVMGVVSGNPWFMVWFLFSIAIGNIIGEGEENVIWNNGICEKYNEPWQFVEREWHSETCTDHYKCQDQHFSASPRDLFRETYKGK